MLLTVLATVSTFLADTVKNVSGDSLGIAKWIGNPMLTAGEILIPAGVAFSGLHKLMNHQEGGAGFLVDMLVKGGGAVLVIELIKNFAFK